MARDPKRLKSDGKLKATSSSGGKRSVWDGARNVAGPDAGARASARAKCGDVAATAPSRRVVVAAAASRGPTSASRTNTANDATTEDPDADADADADVAVAGKRKRRSRVTREEAAAAADDMQAPARAASRALVQSRIGLITGKAASIAAVNAAAAAGRLLSSSLGRSPGGASPKSYTLNSKS